jgi:cytochrome c553
MRTAGKVIVGSALLGTLAWSCTPRAGPEVEPRMIVHYENVGRLYREAAAGRLDGVRTEANELLARESGAGLPQDVENHLEELRIYAGLAARAPDVSSASSAVARVAAACGSCHKAMKRGPRYAVVAGPPDGATPLATRMIRHRWAADRLWDGLVGPSDASWSAGASALRDAPLFTDELTHEVEQYEAVTKLAWTVHELGARANSAREQSVRAALYGELLGTCASCHSLLRPSDH